MIRQRAALVLVAVSLLAGATIILAVAASFWENAARERDEWTQKQVDIERKRVELRTGQMARVRSALAGEQYLEVTLYLWHFAEDAETLCDESAARAFLDGINEIRQHEGQP